MAGSRATRLVSVGAGQITSVVVTTKRGDDHVDVERRVDAVKGRAAKIEVVVEALASGRKLFDVRSTTRRAIR